MIYNNKSNKNKIRRSRDVKSNYISSMLDSELENRRYIIERYNGAMITWTTIQFKKYLMDKTDNEEALTKLFSYTKSLLKSPTGSGKTYSLIEIAKKVALKTGRRIIFAVPKKKQAEQIGHEYNIPYVTGDTKSIDQDGNVIVCVYDSLAKVFNLKEWAIDNKTTICVDECHRMRYDSTFRVRAIHGIKKVIKHTNYIFISATTRVMEDIDFEYKVECKPESPNYNYGLCYICNYNSTLINSVIEVINLVKAGIKRKILLFIENKDTLQKLKTYLETVYGYRVAVLTSETKEEVAMQGLVENSVLEGFDIYLATSVIEEGINIKNKEQFVCIYAVDSLNPSYDSLEQACARLREEGHICVIMKKNSDIDANQDLLMKDNIQSFEELERKVAKVNHLYEQYIECELFKDNKSFIDSITIGRYVYFNDEDNIWEVDKDKYLRFCELQKNKEVANNNTMHEAQVRKRVKAKEFKYLELTSGSKDETDEKYKEISKEFNEAKQQEIDHLIESIAEMKEETRACLFEALYSNSIGQEGSILTDEERELITTIRGHKEVSKLLKDSLKYKIDIEDQIVNLKYDYKTMKHNTKLTKYKKCNIMLLPGVTEIMGLGEAELVHYTKLRKLLDDKTGKLLNNKILLKVYKIKNPYHKDKGLTEKQKNSVFKFINEVYYSCLKANGQIKLGNLILE